MWQCAGLERAVNEKMRARARNPRTETHQLRTERNRENNEVENLDHLGVGIGSAGYKDRTDVEQDGFREVDERAGNTMGAAFDESTLDSGGVSILNGLLEGLLEEPLKRHGTDWAHVCDRLNNRSVYKVRMG